MRRSTRFSGQLPSPPKSFDGSQSSDTSCEVSHQTKITRSNSESASTSPDDRKTRVLRRQSTQNIAGEIRAFFAVSALPTGKNKRDFLQSAIDRVSEFYDGPPKDRGHTPKKGHDGSDIRAKTRDGTNIPIKKHWLTSGLYAGSRTSADNSKILGKAKKSERGPGSTKKFKFMLPIFHGKTLMEQQRDFKLPWNLYATTGEICKPPNWSRIRRNIHIDVDPYDKKAHRPECICRVECDEACLNRAMFYECDDQSCALENPADCSNRTFQQAAIRYADHKARSCGFEVFNTGDRGFGLRALRDFPPNAFILEYRGEVISTEECEHRMVTMYAGRSNYYFLNIDANTVLDAGRKGSEARFANHCCDPNARIEKWIVKGEPRIGVFAGKRGIEAGEEITYDYNFSWFEGAKEQKCMCGAGNCRGFIGKRKAVPPPPKVETLKKGKTVASKVKRVIQGRITKVSKKKVKAHVKDGKVIKATIVTTQTKIKTSKKTKFKTTAKKVKTLAETKKTTALGKRKRAGPSTKVVKKNPPSRKETVSMRKIAKPRSSTTVKSAKPLSNRPIYDTVSHRSRKRNVR